MPSTRRVLINGLMGQRCGGEPCRFRRAMASEMVKGWKYAPQGARIIAGAKNCGPPRFADDGAIAGRGELPAGLRRESARRVVRRAGPMGRGWL
jgi:hypothetical protein